jgi:hypothetical protein
VDINSLLYYYQVFFPPSRLFDISSNGFFSFLYIMFVNPLKLKAVSGQCFDMDNKQTSNNNSTSSSTNKRKAPQLLSATTKRAQIQQDSYNPYESCINSQDVLQEGNFFVRTSKGTYLAYSNKWNKYIHVNINAIRNNELCLLPSVFSVKLYRGELDQRARMLLRDLTLPNNPYLCIIDKDLKYQDRFFSWIIETFAKPRADCSYTYAIGYDLFNTAKFLSTKEAGKFTHGVTKPGSNEKLDLIGFPSNLDLLNNISIQAIAQSRDQNNCNEEQLDESAKPVQSNNKATAASTKKLQTDAAPSLAVANPFIGMNNPIDMKQLEIVVNDSIPFITDSWERDPHTGRPLDDQVQKFLQRGYFPIKLFHLSSFVSQQEAVIIMENKRQNISSLSAAELREVRPFETLKIVEQEPNRALRWPTRVSIFLYARGKLRLMVTKQSPVELRKHTPKKIFHDNLEIMSIHAEPSPWTQRIEKLFGENSKEDEAQAFIQQSIEWQEVRVDHLCYEYKSAAEGIKFLKPATYRTSSAVATRADMKESILDTQFEAALAELDLSALVANKVAAANDSPIIMQQVTQSQYKAQRPASSTVAKEDKPRQQPAGLESVITAYPPAKADDSARINQLPLIPQFDGIRQIALDSKDIDWFMPVPKYPIHLVCSDFAKQLLIETNKLKQNSTGNVYYNNVAREVQQRILSDPSAMYSITRTN